MKKSMESKKPRPMALLMAFRDSECISAILNRFSLGL